VISRVETDNPGDHMDNTLFFFNCLSWFINFDLLVIGVVVGSVGTLFLGPTAYRIHRRYTLRRDWLQDRPRRIVESLTPQWEGYDPKLAGVGKRCICHGRQIHPGERVLLWPETGPMGILHVAVYCETSKELL
jgi:hypothetical protein